MLWSACTSLRERRVAASPGANDQVQGGAGGLGGCCVVIDSLQTFLDATVGDEEAGADVGVLVRYLVALSADPHLPCAVVVLAQVCVCVCVCV